MKLRSGDAIVSRKETNHPILDTMHSLTLNLKNTIGVGSSDPPSEVPSLVRQRVLGQLFLTGSEVQTPPSEVPSSFR